MQWVGGGGGSGGGIVVCACVECVRGPVLALSHAFGQTQWWEDARVRVVGGGEGL